MNLITVAQIAAPILQTVFIVVIGLGDTTTPSG